MRPKPAACAEESLLLGHDPTPAPDTSACILAPACTRFPTRSAYSIGAACLALRRRSPHLFCSAGGGSWHFSDLSAQADNVCSRVGRTSLGTATSLSLTRNGHSVAT